MVYRELAMGRPQVEINWKEVDLFLQAGSNGVEIAERYGIAPDTFYDRCLKDNKIGFTQYAQEKKSLGKALLRAAQYKKAVSGKGDSQMLKWLGIHLLGQKETNLSDIEEASKRGALDAVREIQQENRARDGTISQSEVEAQQPLLDQGCAGQPCQIPNELGTEGVI